MGNDSKNFSIIIAAKNEAETIAAVLEKLVSLTEDLVVVDGHSKDDTVPIAESFGARIVEDNGLGKGDAIREGIKAAQYPVAVFIDADGSHDPDDIPKLVNPIINNEADLVLGSRMLGGSDELFGTVSEVIRLIGSLVISLAINYRYKVRFTDYQNGFRAIRTEVARQIGLKSNSATIEQEMAIKCLNQGFRVMEAPTHESRRKGGKSKISVMKMAHIYVWNLISEIIRPRKKKAGNTHETGSQLYFLAGNANERTYS